MSIGNGTGFVAVEVHLFGYLVQAGVSMCFHKGKENAEQTPSLQAKTIIPWASPMCCYALIQPTPSPSHHDPEDAFS